MVSKTFKVVIGVIAIVAVIVAVALGIYFGIRCNLKARIMNKCEPYLKKNGLTSQNDCEKIWDSFTQAFVGKDPFDVFPENYNSLIHTVSQVSKEPACNRRMFWSKTEEEAHDYADKCSYLTQEETLPAFLLNDITWFGKKVKWCGEPESQEIFTKGCHDRPYKSFWNRSSAAFAASACGDAFVMLDGSMDMPYNRSSMFGDVEVRNFNSQKLNRLTVILVTKEGDATRTNCENDASLKVLESQLKSGITYRCKDVTQSQLQSCIV